jgi:hypothetical protein
MYSSENHLEVTLSAAMKDRALRVHFYQALLESTVWAVQLNDDADDIYDAVLGGGHLSFWNIEISGSLYVPLFTSKEKLVDCIGDDHYAFEMPTIELLELTLGKALIVNPNNETGLIISAEEVSHMLQGEVIATEKIELNDQHEVLFGHLIDTPHKMIDVMSVFFDGCSEVKRAYIAKVYMPKLDSGARITIGFDAGKHYSNIVTKAGYVLNDAYGDDVLIYFCDLNCVNSLVRFLQLECHPFYDCGVDTGNTENTSVIDESISFTQVTPQQVPLVSQLSTVQEIFAESLKSCSVLTSEVETAKVRFSPNTVKKWWQFWKF